MSTRLEDERPPDAIRLRPKRLALLRHRPTNRPWQALNDEPERLAANVRIHRPDRSDHRGTL